MGDTPEKNPEEAYLVFRYLGMGDAPDYKEDTPKILTMGFNHRLHRGQVNEKCLEDDVVGVIISADSAAAREHEGFSYNNTPEGIAKMEKDMSGRFVRFERTQAYYARLILEAVNAGVPVIVH
jgi:hypothetical protein